MTVERDRASRPVVGSVGVGEIDDQLDARRARRPGQLEQQVRACRSSSASPSRACRDTAVRISGCFGCATARRSRHDGALRLLDLRLGRRVARAMLCAVARCGPTSMNQPSRSSMRSPPTISAIARLARELLALHALDSRRRVGRGRRTAHGGTAAAGGAATGAPLICTPRRC